MSQLISRKRVHAPGSLLARWLPRWLLAGLLLFGSEILLWSDPLNRPVADWLLLLVGYITLGALLLDLMVRYRVRDLLGLMTVAGVYGLLNGMLLNPDTTLFDLPRTLITRVTGAHTLLGLEMIVVFLALTGGHRLHFRQVLLVGAMGVGLAWGTWARWSTLQTDITYTTPSLVEMLLIAGSVIVLIAALSRLVVRYGQDLTPDSMRLSLREGAVMALLLALLLFVQIVRLNLDTVALVVTGLLLLLCMAILWFRRGTRLPIILADHIPPRALPVTWVMMVVGVLFVMGIAAYNLPLIGNEDLNQLIVVVYGFGLYGIAWLPTLSLILGARAYIRQVQSRPM